jgi:hypothetical protein
MRKRKKGVKVVYIYFWMQKKRFWMGLEVSPLIGWLRICFTIEDAEITNPS